MKRLVAAVSAASLFALAGCAHAVTDEGPLPTSVRGLPAYEVAPADLVEARTGAGWVVSQYAVGGDVADPSTGTVYTMVSSPDGRLYLLDVRGPDRTRVLGAHWAGGRAPVLGQVDVPAGDRGPGTLDLRNGAVNEGMAQGWPDRYDLQYVDRRDGALIYAFDDTATSVWSSHVADSGAFEVTWVGTTSGEATQMLFDPAGTQAVARLADGTFEAITLNYSAYPNNDESAPPEQDETPATRLPIDPACTALEWIDQKSVAVLCPPAPGSDADEAQLLRAPVDGGALTAWGPDTTAVPAGTGIGGAAAHVSDSTIVTLEPDSNGCASLRWLSHGKTSRVAAAGDANVGYLSVRAADAQVYADYGDCSQPLEQSALVRLDPSGPVVVAPSPGEGARRLWSVVATGR